MRRILSILGFGAIAAAVSVVYVHQMPAETYTAPKTTSITNQPSSVESPGVEAGRATSTDGGFAKAPLSLATTTIALSDGGQQTFQLAGGYKATVAARNLGKARFMAESSDGRLFVPDLVNYRLSRDGKLYVLDDFDAETGTFNTKHAYLTGLRGPNSVAFYTDESGQTWLYLALTQRLLRYPYEAGSTKPTAEPEVVIEFPNKQAESANSVVWHITRTIAFHDDRLFVSVGSGCNACEETDYRRAALYSMTPTGTDIRPEARGLRNAVGFDWAEGQLYATENGVDHLGPSTPDDLVYRIERGEHYGWPYCYESDASVLRDTSRTWSSDYDCAEAPTAFAALEPHAAPLGITYFSASHTILADSFLLAQHGAFDPAVGTAPKVLRLTREGDSSVFMRGFEGPNGDRQIRPVDMFIHDTKSFFLTDDEGGRVFYITRSE